MSFQISVMPSAREFTVQTDETILEAALREGLVLPYGCKSGACGSCKARIIAGEIEQGAHAPGALTDTDRAAGWSLLCCAKPCSDLQIEARVVSAARDIPVRKLPCRIQSIERIGTDVALLRVQLPASERLLYLAGQYIELVLTDGTRRSYSMASAPDTDDLLELHVRHMPGGRFTDALFGVSQPAVKLRDILRFEGPMGSFFLRQDSPSPVVLLASGTGFAPIKALVEQAIRQGSERVMRLYWGGREPADLYMDALARQWADQYAHISYIPVISEPLPEHAWAGRTGLVHQAVIQDLPDLSAHQVYACGAPAMVAAARADFTGRCALPDDAFIADAFTSAADLAGGAGQ